MIIYESINNIMNDTFPNNQCGSLDIITGPMFSSKTTTLIGRLLTEFEIGFKVLYINSVIDDRTQGYFSTHNSLYKNAPVNKKITCLKTTNIHEILSKATFFDVIGIDEAQFFDDLYEGVKMLVNKMHKRVIVAGLNGSFKREPFGKILQIDPLSDTHTKLTAWCLECLKSRKRTQAPFTHRILKIGPVKQSGGIDEYIPVCRKCYEFLNKDSEWMK